MSMLFRTAAALGLSLEVVQNGFGNHTPLLPGIQGNPLAQLGFIFAAAFVLTELVDGARTVVRWFGERQTRPRPWSSRSKRKQVAADTPKS